MPNRIHRKMFRWLALCWCAIPLMGAAAHGGRSPAPISAITLERRCMGCADEFVLRLQRDGTALLTQPGNARMGTVDQRLAGRVSQPEFEALALQLVAAGFFAMDALYEDPQMRDGSVLTISVEAFEGMKQVSSREEAGPPELQALHAAIASLRSRIAFKAMP